MSSERLKILITNDDGFASVGIRTLTRELAEFADVFMVAPLHDQSGSSFSLSLHGPVQVTSRENMLVVHGTPADCIHMALHDGGALPFKPDLTVSGINIGANLGYDVLYSGTCAAAGESVMQGVPAISFSLCNDLPDNFPPHNFESAATSAAKLVVKLAPRLIESPRLLLNVNFPDLPLDRIGGFQTTRLGHNHHRINYSQLQRDDEVGLRAYQLSFIRAPREHEPGTDAAAVAAGDISVTPLSLMLTSEDELASVAKWSEKLSI